MTIKVNSSIAYNDKNDLRRKYNTYYFQIFILQLIVILFALFIFCLMHISIVHKELLFARGCFGTTFDNGSLNPVHYTEDS